MDHLIAFCRRRRRLLLLASAAALATYKLYHHPTIAAHRRRIAALASAVSSLTDATSSAASAVSLLSSDLTTFLRSDSDQIPSSLKQLSKLAASNESSTSLSNLSQSLAVGLLRAYRVANPDPDPQPESAAGFADKLLDKLFSTAGSGFASAVAGSFARNAALSFFEKQSGSVTGSGSGSGAAKWVDVVVDEPCKAAIADWIRVFVSTAVGVFIDKTIHINAYDQLFEGLTNPNHEARAKEVIVSVCNNAVETLVNTTHRVLSSNPKREEPVRSGTGGASSSNGWVGSMSSTLAVPSNRRFVLDVTGRVTFETVRSFLEFVLWRLHDGVSRGGNAVLETGLQVVRYASLKSIVLAAVCIALCLRVLTSGTMVLMPA